MGLLVVVANDYSACSELLRDRGELIKVRELWTTGRYNVEVAIPDVDDLVERLNVLYSDSELRRKHSKAGREFSLGFGWDAIAEQWLNLFERAHLRDARGGC